MIDVGISVIIASDRGGPDLARSLQSLIRQKNPPHAEVLVVSAHEPPPVAGQGVGEMPVGWVRMEDRNPASRRNRAAEFAAGRLLAFLDDDASAAPDWLARAARLAGTEGIFGGCDLLPEGSPFSERISDLLLATPLIGSGVPAHERHPRRGVVKNPSAITLCNLFVTRDLFDRLNGFDESLGYIGEDTDFVHRARKAGHPPLLDPGLKVFHRRRAFPLAFLRQRWRYRIKTGRLLVTRPALYLRPTPLIFLLTGALAIVLTILFGAKFVLPAAIFYALVTWLASAKIWVRDPFLFPFVPFAFAIHHANYWLAFVAGIFRGLWESVSGTGARPVPVPPPVPNSLPKYPS